MHNPLIKMIQRIALLFNTCDNRKYKMHPFKLQGFSTQCSYSSKQLPHHRYLCKTNSFLCTDPSTVTPKI